MSNMIWNFSETGPGCYFTYVSWAFQNNLAKYRMPEITFMVWISSWNLICVPLWAQVQMLSFKFSLKYDFRKNILESSQNISETTPRCYIS